MKNRVSQLFALLSVFMLAVCVGCGGNAKVTGKVTFSDGTPVTFGTIIFSNDTTICKGEINEKGEYAMRTFKPGDGVPKGTYKIYITDTLRFGESKTAKTAGAEKGDAVEYSLIGKAENVIPHQYGNPDESPFEPITVNGSMKRDLVIEAAAPEAAPNAG